MQELRVWKEKVQKLETQMARDEVSKKNQEAKIVTVQNENKQYQETIKRRQAEQQAAEQEQPQRPTQ